MDYEELHQAVRALDRQGHRRPGRTHEGLEEQIQARRVDLPHHLDHRPRLRYDNGKAHPQGNGAARRVRLLRRMDVPTHHRTGERPDQVHRRGADVHRVPVYHHDQEMITVAPPY